MSSLQTQQSNPLSDNDLLVLKGWVVNTASRFLLSGIYTTLSLTALCLFIVRGIHHKPRAILALVTFAMLLTAISSTIVQVQEDLTQIPMNGFDPPPLDQIISLVTSQDISHNFLDSMIYVVGDGIVVWRAWKLCPHQIFVKLALTICMMGSSAGALLHAGLIAKNLTANFNASTSGRFNDLILAIPLCLTNLTATALIGYKAWNLGLTNGSSKKVQKILLLLIESGTLYLWIWIGYAVAAHFAQSNTDIFIQVYSTILPQLSAIYPILIILAAGHENARPDNENDMSLSQSIQFASRQASSQDAHDTMIGSHLGSTEASISNQDRGEGNDARIANHRESLVPEA
ncbi:hypothetical protein K435DRAFT_853565 [Dendrothele bispora CBS 962.96]|uniref:Family A G protein-coupled receptor-like protein n=1 Tax=Dendrothele bispora (strain CBS 962.96) TaxID=1314807 RepID=A0A4S8MGS8_DENBC|nr:hypothetical protein K435DRAFT_853565 [Dendrothele bispora CBS 962.96]